MAAFKDENSSPVLIAQGLICATRESGRARGTCRTWLPSSHRAPSSQSANRHREASLCTINPAILPGDPETNGRTRKGGGAGTD